MVFVVHSAVACSLLRHETKHAWQRRTPALLVIFGSLFLSPILSSQRTRCWMGISTSHVCLILKFPARRLTQAQPHWDLSQPLVGTAGLTPEMCSRMVDLSRHAGIRRLMRRISKFSLSFGKTWLPTRLFRYCSMTNGKKEATFSKRVD